MSEEQKITLYRFAAMRSKLDQFEDDSLKILLKGYKKAVKETMKEVEDLAERLGEKAFSTKRAKAMLDEALMMSEGIQKKLAGDITDMSVKAGKFSYDGINPIVSWDGQVKDFNLVTLSATQLKQFVVSAPLGGHILEDWVSRTFKGYTKEIKADLLAGYIKGESYRKLSARLQEKFDIGKRDAISLARTYVQTVNVKAAQDIYEANDDVVKKIEWSAIMEGGNTKTGRGTCSRCQALDGMQWATKEKKMPPCPLHVRCRCMLVPVTMTWRELGFDVDEMKDTYRSWSIRADKAVDTGGRAIIDYGFTGQNYAGWWKTRSKAFQDNSIGPRRAAMIRGNKIKFQDIVDPKTGRLLTLKELGYSPPKPKPPKPAPVKKKTISIKKKPAPTKKPTVDKFIPTMQFIKREFRKSTEGGIINRKINKFVKIQQGYWKQLNEAKSPVDRKWMDEITVKIASAEKEILKLQERKTLKKRLLIREAIKPPKGGKIDWSIGDAGKLSINKNMDEWKDNFETVEDMLHPSVLAKLPPVKLTRIKDKRAHYKNGRQTILMGNEHTKTLVHEYGHHLEWENGLYELAKEFRKSRTIGERLSHIYKDEWGYKDKFYKHYCGKEYSFKSTEIISMGLEKMYFDPLDFFEDDPEYFEFILKVMWGES